MHWRLKKLFSTSTQCGLQKVARYSHLNCSELSTFNGHGLQIRDEKSLLFSIQFPEQEISLYKILCLHVVSACLVMSFTSPTLICGNKMPTRCNRWFLLQILLLVQHVSGTIMPIIRSSRVLYRWLLPVVFRALVFKLSVWCGAESYVSGLRAAALLLAPHIKTSLIFSPQ